MHVEPEAEYTDAACVPYTASALAIGEESIYAAFGVDLSQDGRGEGSKSHTDAPQPLPVHGIAAHHAARAAGILPG